MSKNVYAVYFSPTGNSEKSALSVAEEFGEKVNKIDLTVVKNEIEKKEFGIGDLVIFSAPVYGGKILKEAKERFKKAVHGDATPCIIIATYGNRHYDNALMEMSDLAISLGFIPVGYAALVGRHTFGEIEVNRPNASDLEENKAFAVKVKEKLSHYDFSIPIIPGDPEYEKIEKGGTGGKFRPLTDKNSCVDCKMCASNCPMQAIDYDDVSKINNDLCISCFRCIRKCPTGAKNMNEENYLNFAKDFTAKLSESRPNEYFY